MLPCGCRPVRVLRSCLTPSYQHQSAAVEEIPRPEPKALDLLISCESILDQEQERSKGPGEWLTGTILSAVNFTFLYEGPWTPEGRRSADDVGGFRSKDRMTCPGGVNAVPEQILVRVLTIEGSDLRRHA